MRLIAALLRDGRSAVCAVRARLCWVRRIDLWYFAISDTSDEIDHGRSRHIPSCAIPMAQARWIAAVS